VPDPQIIEHPKRFPGEISEFRVISLGLELHDHYYGEDHLMLGEPERSLRVRQQYRRVEHEGTAAIGRTR
jgi:hypothetical protein